MRSIVSPPYYFSLLVYDSMRRMRRPSSAGQRCRSIALGKGLAALGHLGLHRLNFTSFASNERSLALAKRCGFVEEARFRKARRTSQGWVDQVELGLLDDEWQALRDQ